MTITGPTGITASDQATAVKPSPWPRVSVVIPTLNEALACRRGARRAGPRLEAGI